MSSVVGNWAADFLESELDETKNRLDRSLAEEIVPLNVFVEDRKYLGLPPLSQKQFDAVEAMTDIFTPTYIEGVLQWGKGAGKDHVCRVISARTVYQLLCLNDPLSYFGLPSSDYVYIINVALSAQQANQAFFQPFVSMIQKSPWFKNKWQETVGRLEFEKHVIAISGHSQQEVQEGLNLILAILDEIAAFRTDSELVRSKNPVKAATAENLYRVLRTSVNSRFPNLGKVVLISYPRYDGDFITTKYERGIHDPKTYTSFGATWEVHPTKKFEDFAWDFQMDPEGSWSMYGCKPPKAIDAYFKRKDLVYDVCGVEESKSGDVQLKEEWIGYQRPIEGYDVLDWYQPDPTDLMPRWVHIDLGITKDACGVAMCRPTGLLTLEIPDGQGGTREVKLPKVEIDFVHQLVAKKGEEIDIASVRGIVLQLIERGFNVKKVTYDSYQSRESIQYFTNLGIGSEILSVDRNMEGYDALKSLIYGGRLKCPPSVTLAEELVRLVQITAHKVDHIQGGSKDVADAVAGACAQAARAALYMIFDDSYMTAPVAGAATYRTANVRAGDSNDYVGPINISDGEYVPVVGSLRDSPVGFP
jgi:hypothetical protein